MRLLIGLLAALWALANLFGALVLLVNGVAPKTLEKGFIDVSLMLLGGLLVAALALLLLWQVGQLIRSSEEDLAR